MIKHKWYTDAKYSNAGDELIDIEGLLNQER